MTSFNIHCPHCGQELEIDLELHLGQVVDCPACAGSIRLEPENPPSEEPSPEEHNIEESLDENQAPNTAKATTTPIDDAEIREATPAQRKKIIYRKTVTQGLRSECPSCGAENSVIAKQCKDCGTELHPDKVKPPELHVPAPAGKKPSTGLIAAWILVVIGLIVGALLMFGGQDNKAPVTAQQPAGEVVMEVTTAPGAQALVHKNKEAEQRKAEQQKKLSAFSATLEQDLASKPTTPTPPPPDTEPTPQSVNATPPVEPAATEEADSSEEIWGYRVDGDKVIFQYNQAFYPHARFPDGTVKAVPAADITDVVVAGSFNNWNTKEPGWMMQMAEEGSYFLERDQADFGTLRQMPFKFVVNGTIWIGAPTSASNKTAIEGDEDTYNLILFP